MENESDEVKKEFTIKIKGEAYSKDISNLENVKAFDDFVVELFEKYREVIQQEFDKEKELGYDKIDLEKQEMIDPYLTRFSFDTVTKDVR